MPKPSLYVLSPTRHENRTAQARLSLLAYVVSGELGVDYGIRGKRTFSPGQAYIEAIEWCHIGYAVGDEAVEILGFYLGQQDPDQVKPEPCTASD